MTLIWTCSDGELELLLRKKFIDTIKGWYKRKETASEEMINKEKGKLFVLPAEEKVDAITTWADNLDDQYFSMITMIMKKKVTFPVACLLPYKNDC